MKTLLLSDLHIGFRYSRAKDILWVLENEEYDRLILVGDIFDIQQAKKRAYVDEYHTKVTKKILKIAKRKKVVYILGNHDWDIRHILPYTRKFADIELCTSYCYWTNDRKLVGCIHGHQFDNIPKYLSIIGDFLYNVGLRSNSFLNRIRFWMDLEYFSYSKWCKDRVKNLISKTLNTHDKQLTMCKSNDYNVLVTGHTHMPRIDKHDDCLLVNTGAFVEISTYVIEENGVFRLKTKGKTITQGS